MITIYVKRIRSYMHGFLRYRNNNKVKVKVKLAVFLIFLSWSHAPDLQFSLGQTNTGRLSCYTA